jgi:glutathione S-transferase
MSWLGMVGMLVGALAALVVAWAVERRRRRIHPVPPGHRPEISLPFEAPFELHHNAFSLCSMKTRVCLAELGIPYASHPVDLIETGAYENVRPRLLRVNPGGTVPVLVHEGHPIYESHEQIRYAARFAAAGSPSLVPDDPARASEMEAWIDRASLTPDPLSHGDESAANAVPGLTVPLFATMIETIPYWRIVEGLLFHFDRARPMLFLLLKWRGVEGLPRIAPVARAIARSRRQLGAHLDALEAQLEKEGGPWILGPQYTLADVSWLVVLERLRQVDMESAFLGGGQRPHTAAYGARLRERPAYREAIVGHAHPAIDRGRRRLVEAKAQHPELRALLEGDDANR